MNVLALRGGDGGSGGSCVGAGGSGNERQRTATSGECDHNFQHAREAKRRHGGLHFSMGAGGEVSAQVSAKRPLPADTLQPIALHPTQLYSTLLNST